MTATSRPPGTEHARELPDAAVEIGHVVEHPGGHDEVELTVGERELLHVGDPRIDTALPRQLDHPRREVDGHDLGSGVAGDPLGELAPAAAHLEHAPGRQRPDLDHRRLPRVDACLDAGVGGGAFPQPRVVGVLARDERRVVELHALSATNTVWCVRTRTGSAKSGTCAARCARVMLAATYARISSGVGKTTTP